MRFERGSFGLVVMLVLGAGVVGSANRDFRIEAINDAEQAAVWGGDGGGDPYPCIKSTQGCPDSTYPSTCTWNANLQQCVKCRNTYGPWTFCGSTRLAQTSCSSTITAQSPWCGNLFTGPKIGNDCTNGCFNQGKICGQQVPDSIVGSQCP
jgi:hypothetical protein